MTAYLYGWQDLIVRVKHEADGVKVRYKNSETEVALWNFSRACQELCLPIYGKVSWVIVRAGLASYR